MFFCMARAAEQHVYLWVSEPTVYISTFFEKGYTYGRFSAFFTLGVKSNTVDLMDVHKKAVHSRFIKQILGLGV